MTRNPPLSTVLLTRPFVRPPWYPIECWFILDVYRLGQYNNYHVSLAPAQELGYKSEILVPLKENLTPKRQIQRRGGQKENVTGNAGEMHNDLENLHK